jgi:hypothetical protein
VISILRPTRRTDLVTAEVFESLFRRHVGAAASVRAVPLEAWCTRILGPVSLPIDLGHAAERFAEATARAQFLCPSWEAVPLLPLFAALRNRSHASVRLLIVGHTPAGYALEWALLAPLLAPGDCIIAPSQSAQATIGHLCQPLMTHIEVVPHPMQRLPGVPSRSSDRVVSLARLTPGKLLHRQVDALAIVRGRRRSIPVLEIAGSETSGRRTGCDTYTRSLIARARRLGVQDKVRFVGAVRGQRSKAALLSGAKALVNLSVTVEESFGKAPVEALGAGVPVLATKWDGLPETVGACGEMVPVSAGRTAEVGAEAVASALERLLDAPPSIDACVGQAARFAPEVIVPRYVRALESAWANRDRPPDWPDATRAAAPEAGVLSVIAPLTDFSWQEVFDWSMTGSSAIRRAWSGEDPAPSTNGDILRRLILDATRQPLEHFLAGMHEAPHPPDPTPTRVPRAKTHGEFLTRIAASAAECQMETARQACMLAVLAGGRPDLVRQVAPLSGSGAATNGSGLSVDYSGAEALSQSDPSRAFALCAAALDRAPAAESEAHRVRQIARLARRRGDPGAALRWLELWLAKFPDAPEAGSVWLALAANLAQGRPPRIAYAEWALARARALLGPADVIITLSRHINVLRGAAALLDV